MSFGKTAHTESEKMMKRGCFMQTDIFTDLAVEAAAQAPADAAGVQSHTAVQGA